MRKGESEDPPGAPAVDGARADGRDDGLATRQAPGPSAGDAPTLPLAEERRFLELVEALEDESSERRERELREVDPDLAERVRERLADPTASATASSSATSPPGGRLSAGDEVGPYRVLRHLGAGGMGCVYLAEQGEPIQRRVALKVLRLNLRDGAGRERFAIERHAMGRLDHPNVAKILDAGVAAGGTPYLAMEWIDGVPLVKYCRERGLSVEERLRLFLPICRGVNHAHQKFLLHRDIKPSNVLVAEIDGEAVPKLIDFGVAQFLDEVGAAPAGDRNRGFGTPRYMSPEALGLGGDVDTRSDVFSLGVVLYEILAGRRPWRGEERSRWSGPEAASPPVPPSAVASATDGEAGGRGVPKGEHEGGDLGAPQARKLRGDLDAAILRALAPAPEDRYPSAAALADDLQRHLDDLPVKARGDGRFYRLGKLFRRHRLAAVATALVVAALLAGAVGTGLGLVKARRAESRAVAEAEEAERARRDAEEVAGFLADLLSSPGPSASGMNRSAAETTALELLERGAARLETELADQPATRARLEAEIGDVYRQLGRLDDAQVHLDRALDLSAQVAEERPLLAAYLMQTRAELEIARADAPAAGRHLDEALALAQGETDSARRLRASLLGNLGRQRRLAGDHAAAETYLRQALALDGDLDGEESGAAAAHRSNLGALYFTQNRWADAEAQWRRALTIRRRVEGDSHASVATMLDNLGAAVASQGRLDEAAPLFAEALEIRRTLLDENHPRLAISLNNLGVLYQDLGDLERSEEHHRRALEIRRAAFGPDHPATAWSLDNLAHVRHNRGDPDEAERLQSRALAVREALYGGDHLEVARSLDHLADLALAAGEAGRAVDLRRRVVRVRRDGLEEGHPLLGESEVELGEALWRAGDPTAARPHLDAGLAILEAAGDDAAEELAEAEAIMTALEAGE